MGTMRGLSSMASEAIYQSDQNQIDVAIIADGIFDAVALSFGAQSKGVGEGVPQANAILVFQYRASHTSWIFIDYSGDKVAIIHPATGEIRFAEIFVAVLGASAYAYAEATWTQTLPDWIASHVRLFGHLMSVPALLIPDHVIGNIIGIGLELITTTMPCMTPSSPPRVESTSCWPM
ncbi:hypothetical protein C4901_03715 [Acidiferrobacter sp. SPIII_3]|jgi:hypothetical protein|nr:hypothetical protein C4901_03715 [Acidiferrobacter sp. SPIII_3]